MKVTGIKSFPVADEDGRGYFIVKVETDAGIHGLGRWVSGTGPAPSPRPWSTFQR